MVEATRAEHCARENGRQSACTPDEGAISMPSTERDRELRAHAKVRRVL